MNPPLEVWDTMLKTSTRITLQHKHMNMSYCYLH